LDEVLKGGWYLKIMEGLVGAVYAILPLASPFQDTATVVSQSMHASKDAWYLLMAYGGYAVALSGFFFCLSIFLFHRKGLS